VNPPRQPGEVAAALAAFLARFLEDRQAGRVRGLAAYQSLCPGFEEIIAREYQELQQSPADGAGAAEAPVSIGSYRLLERLGEGGMGTVYLVQQETPVARQVALKLIKLGMDTREVVTRFKAEQQALALMDHPHIARVFDAGATEQGRPYFVMEYVPGVPLLRSCDQDRLTVGERLRLFVAVCEGVQHAHQKGIIHRDLKPSNVLVSRVDGRAAPKIIDFGLAKAVGSRTGQTLLTDPGRLVGTLEYMSPEQAGGRDLDLDTRTDIYSLGIVLYELLTGVRPFDRREVRDGGDSELRRRILEVEPSRPSVRLLAQGAAAAELARLRGTDVRGLGRALRGDLDWIVLKAIEKDRDKRYASASELAQDVIRHQSHEPVMAGPPSTWYRLRKYVRRNQRTLVAAGAVVAALATGLLVSIHQHAAAQAHLTNYRRMADVKRLQDLQAAEQELWPAWPEKIPAMRAWLDRANELRARRGPHEQRLAELETALRGGSGDPVTLGEMAWQRDTLAGLVAGIATLEEPDPRKSTVRSVVERIQAAAAVGRISLEDQVQAWTACCDAVAASSVYQGLRMAPQVGLVPLGRNERTGLFEFWHVPSGDRPAWDAATGRVKLDDGTGLVLVLLPPGTFAMGARKPDPGPGPGPNLDPDATPFEAPVHSVSLDAFFLSRFEMTQGQWRRWVGDNPSHFLIGKPAARAGRLVTATHPVEQVTHVECSTVVKQMGLSLPTEAQWEYACRAGTTTVFSTGDDPVSLLGAANIADEASRAAMSGNRGWTAQAGFDDDGHTVHAPVGSLAPNAFGLFDVHGNVSEWCRDWLAPFTLPVAAGDGARLVPPAEVTSGRVKACTLRGGSWFLPAYRCRSANRSQEMPHVRNSALGVRPARPVSGLPGPAR
jgi:serine/threonine protein kinase/formylglycine-generating enzyme required for sulfatase activity